MENQITIREAVTEYDVVTFWEQLHNYHKRDIFPSPASEDLEYFLSSEYYDHMMKIHRRPEDRCYFLFFHRDGRDIGFAMPVIFTSEDGIKDCSACLRPHKRECYGDITKKLGEVIKLVQKK